MEYNIICKTANLKESYLYETKLAKKEAETLAKSINKKHNPYLKVWVIKVKRKG